MDLHCAECKSADRVDFVCDLRRTMGDLFTAYTRHFCIRDSTLEMGLNRGHVKTYIRRFQIFIHLLILFFLQ